MEDKINVAVVDDHHILRKGLIYLLKSLKNINIIAEASTGEEFIEILKTHNVDIVFMDIMMPGMSGIETSKKALEIKPELKIIILSMYNEAKYINETLDLGVCSYLVKNYNIDEITIAIKTVINGGTYFSNESINLLYKEGLFNEPYNNTKHSNKINLTKKQLEIIGYICLGKTTAEISEIMKISPRTVEGHKYNIYKLTNTHNAVTLIIYAKENNIFY